MALDVTISIVNHENRGPVLESLAAIAADAAGRHARVEVVVVDNVSRDGSADAIRAAFPDVEVVERGERAGYGANHNVALRRARGRHVMLLNDDAKLFPGALDALCRHLDEHPDVAVAAPTVRRPDGTTEPTLWPRPSLRGDLVGAVGFLGVPGVRDGDPIGWATGCALMVRRDAVLAIGGFDEGFFLYSEEIDLCTRLADAGHGVAHVPGAVVEHEGQVSTGASSPERAVEMARARRRYWRIHYSTPARLVAQLAVGAQFTAMAALARLRGRPARPLLLQAVGCFREVSHPGIRERAEAFNRSRPSPTG